MFCMICDKKSGRWLCSSCFRSWDRAEKARAGTLIELEVIAAQWAILRTKRFLKKSRNKS